MKGLQSELADVRAALDASVARSDSLAAALADAQATAATASAAADEAMRQAAAAATAQASAEAREAALAEEAADLQVRPCSSLFSCCAVLRTQRCSRSSLSPVKYSSGCKLSPACHSKKLKFFHVYIPRSMRCAAQVRLSDTLAARDTLSEQLAEEREHSELYEAERDRAREEAASLSALLSDTQVRRS